VEGNGRDERRDLGGEGVLRESEMGFDKEARFDLGWVE